MKSVLHSRIFGKPRSGVMQFGRYVVVGGVAAAVDTGSLYYLYSQWGVEYLVAGGVGFLLGVIINYLISVLWVFESSGNFKEEFALFAIIGIGGLGLTELILWGAVHHGGASVLVGKAIALWVVLIWNFGMRKKFVFRKSVVRDLQAT